MRTKMTSEAHADGVSMTSYSIRYMQHKYFVRYSILSAFFIVFYRTKNSLIWSAFNWAHLVTFFITAIFMYLLSIILAKISSFLDRRRPWHLDGMQRLIAQCILGIELVSFVSLHIIYAFYDFAFAINLRETDYLEKDFIVVLACIVGINIHHYFLYQEASSKANIQQLNILTQENTRLTNHVKYLQEKLTHNQSKIFSNEIAEPISWKVIDSQLDKTFQLLSGEGIIKSIEIAAFFLEKKERKTMKVVHVLLWDGSKHALRDVESLASVRAELSFLFQYAGRDFLINKYAISGVETTSHGKHELIIRIPGMDPITISAAVYAALSKHLQK